MFKTLAVLAVIVLAVSAEKYKPPKLPCDYELKLIKKADSKSEDLIKLTINGRYLRMKMADDGDSDIYAVYRPDITKKEGGIEMIGVAASKGDDCKSDYTSLDAYLAFLKTLSGQIFGAVDYIDWKNKKEGEYDGEKCTVYYDDDEKDYALYVKDDYPLAMHAYDGTDLVFEWEWSAPMKKFKLDACKDDFGKTPSDDYVFCAAASVKVAVVALLVALVSALF
jgi:hypothetical protein